MKWNYFLVRVPTNMGPRATLLQLERAMAETVALLGSRITFHGRHDNPYCFLPRTMRKILDEELGDPCR
jgi:hypothetical protein